MKQLISMMIVWLYCTMASAQWGHHIQVGAGLMNYAGDLKNHPFPEAGYLNYHIDLGYEAQYKQIYRVGIHYNFGYLNGADSLNGNSTRNLDFTSSLHNFTGTFKLNLIGWSLRRRGLFARQKRRKAEFNLDLGLGICITNPQSYYGNELTPLRPLGTEGQNIVGLGYDKPYLPFSMNARLGFEFIYQLKWWWGFRSYIHYNFTTTDYIDDVGGTYADYEQLMLAGGGPKAVAMAHKGSGPYPERGATRGGGFSDGYLMIGIGFDFTVYLKEKIKWVGNIR